MYVYKHTNGKYIKKTDWAVNSIGTWDYFDSPFVAKWWHFDTEEEADNFIKNQMEREDV